MYLSYIRLRISGRETKDYKTTLFSKSRLVTNAVLSAEWPDGAWYPGHTQVAPGGLPSSPDHPCSPLNWSSGWAKGPVLCLVPARDATTPNPSSPSASPSLLQWTVPKCQHVPPGPSQACPYCPGAAMTSSVESTHPWREHSGPRTGRLTGLGTDNTVNRAEWQTASQNNEKLTAVIGKHLPPLPYSHPQRHTWTCAHTYTVQA